MLLLQSKIFAFTIRTVWVIEVWPSGWLNVTHTISSVPLRPPAITFLFVLLLYQHLDQQYVSRPDVRVLHVVFSHSNNIFISYRRIFFGLLSRHENFH